MEAEATFIKTIHEWTTVPFDRHEIMTLLNFHWLGTEHCNTVDSKGQIVPVEHEHMKELQEAHNNISTLRQVYVAADLYSDGSLRNLKILSKK